MQPDRPESWDGRIFLSFDLDWAPDAVIAATVDLVEEAGVAATWFVTHDTPILRRLRANLRFELGIHPNFLPLLMQGNGANGGSAGEVVDRLLEIVPEAKSVRSHSLVQSCRLSDLFRSRGLTHEANNFIPEADGTVLQPWLDTSGMIRIPYGWQDNFWCSPGPASGAISLAPRPGLRGYTFHPVHIFLNTEDMSRYEAARPDFRDPSALAGHRNAAVPGVADMLERVLDLASPEAVAARFKVA